VWDYINKVNLLSLRRVKREKDNLRIEEDVKEG